MIILQDGFPMWEGHLVFSASIKDKTFVFCQRKLFCSINGLRIEEVWVDNLIEVLAAYRSMYNGK